MNTKKITLILLVATFITYSCKNDSKKEDAKNNNQPEVVDMHNAENSLDWAGYYFGVLPCASCPGIKTSITLNEDSTFERTTEYMGEKDAETEIEKGTFQWAEDGTIITIKENKYLVGEGTLTSLDADGKVITGELAENYVLKKSELQEEPTATPGIYVEEFTANDGKTYTITFNTNEKTPTATVETDNFKKVLEQTEAWAKGAEYKKDNVSLISKGETAVLTINNKKIQLKEAK